MILYEPATMMRCAHLLNSKQNSHMTSQQEFILNSITVSHKERKKERKNRIMEFIRVAIWLLIVASISFSHQFTCSAVNVLLQGSSLSVEEEEHHVLLSPNAVFSAGFHAVGSNAYSFAVWFTQPPAQNAAPTVVWMANRNQPVNGKRSTLSLLKTGNLLLQDAGEVTVWSTETSSLSPVELILTNTGNLVLRETGPEEGDDNSVSTLWQSFDFPTNTLLPQQQLTRYTNLISSRSGSNHSSGYYKLFFDNDNVIRLLYDGPEISSIYWPDPGLVSWQVGRSTYNGTRVAVLDSLGKFNSSDGLGFVTSDYGTTLLQRRLTLDYDGNVRVYSRKDGTEEWYVSWQAISQPCSIHGICGSNSTCSYDRGGSRRCSCLPGYRIKNNSDWSVGCEPIYDSSSCSSNNGSYFVRLPHVDFYGYDFEFFPNSTFEDCLNACLQSCNCKSFQYKFIDQDGHFNCYPKSSLLNGFSSPSFPGEIYLKLPRSLSQLDLTNGLVERLNTACSSGETVLLERAYMKHHQNGKVKLLLWFAPGLGVLEAICILFVWCFLIRTRPNSDAYAQGYLPAGTGFRKYRYSEMKRATKSFSQEIGRGASGIVYKGELPDHPVVAIKRLKEANQGEDEFLDEVSIIGNLNHMNLIKMWGYCAEGKHRMLVYEYMEKGSLAENLGSNNINALDFGTRFNIALGVARGLAYLHEECLEWILHCDVKPQNILLDSNYEPKVADFGLSKLLNRNDDSEHSNNHFSRIRGTRGYMAPEWVFNLPITSKVDVYSYGIVVLEMVTGKSPTMGVQEVDGFSEEKQHWRLVSWMRDKRAKGSSKLSWLKQIVDPVIGRKFDTVRLEILVDVALQCVEEDKDARPTMRHVVEMLQSHENL